MLRYAGLLDALKSCRIAGRRVSGHYDHDDTYNIGPHPLYYSEVRRETRHTERSPAPQEGSPSVRYEPWVDSRTGERLFRRVTR